MTSQVVAILHRLLLTGAILFVSGGPTQAEDPPGKTAFVGLDLNGDGKLSKEEYLAAPGMADEKIARRNFKVVDFDHDQALSLEEFRALPGRLPSDQRGTIPDPVAELAANALKTFRAALKGADRNQDGKLSAAEWPQELLRTKLRPFGDLKFGVWDADGNGVVDGQEAERLIAVGFGTAYQDGTPIRSTNGRVLYTSWIRGADANGDLTISRSEFVTSYWLTPPERSKWFTLIDGNADGELHCTELLKYPAFNIDVLEMFLSFDKDLDGGLNLEEILLNPSTGASKQQAVHALEACDDDHDGKLSLQEYMLAPPGLAYVVLRLFDRTDSDDDGQLG